MELLELEGKIKMALFELELESDLEVRREYKKSLINFIIGLGFLYNFDEIKFIVPVLYRLVNEYIQIEVDNQECDTIVVARASDGDGDGDISDWFWRVGENFEGIELNDVNILITATDIYTYNLIDGYGSGCVLIKNLVLTYHADRIFDAYNILSENKLEKDEFMELFSEKLRESLLSIECI